MSDLIDRLRNKKIHPWEICDEAADELERQAKEIAELKEQLETESIRLEACGVAALGWFDGCKDEYRSASLEDTIKLYASHTALRAVAKEMAEALSDCQMFIEKRNGYMNVCKRNADKALSNWKELEK